jgi:hypothetical protein
MAADPRIARYRRWYARLLRLYPTPYRARFGESMAQTFHDLCRERLDTRRPLLAYVLWLFAETSAGIIKEHVVTDRPVAADRPLAITLLAILAAIGGPVLLFASHIWINIERVGGLMLVIAGAIMVLALFYLAFAFAAWTLRPWGWVVGLIVAVGTIATFVPMLFNEMTNVIDEAPMLEIIAGGFMGVAIIGLYILLQPPARAVFGRA